MWDARRAGTTDRIIEIGRGKLKSRIATALLPLLLISLMPTSAVVAKSEHSERVVVKDARLNAALESMVADARAAGTSALVWQDGREVYFGTAGYSDREAKRPMARDTIVQIFSMTKPVTGVALMQLWEQGRFGLDDPIARFLPEYGGAYCI